MFLQRSSRAIRRQWHVYKGLNQAVVCGAYGQRQQHLSWAKAFHSTRRMQVVKPVLLADIGEGIVECEIIQWFVEPEARVEEFSPLCEVQSDKASVEITSRFSGVVKKLHYEAGDMAKVGKPFVDIDIQGDIKKEDLEALSVPEPSKREEAGASVPPNEDSISSPPAEEQKAAAPAPTEASLTKGNGQSRKSKNNGTYGSLATPAVRHLSKVLTVDITEVQGTGRDGRVLKEDVYKFAESRTAGATTPPPAPANPSSPGFSYPQIPTDTAQVETPAPLTNVQAQMFKTMTRSLSIPHFIYADEIDFSQLHGLRSRLNESLAREKGALAKVSYLPFIIKAVSMALYQYPILNARVDIDNSTEKPSLVMRSQHNIGIAMDTPSGLLVPVIKNVGSLNVYAIATELVRLQSLATTGRLSVQDLSGGTITVSNIGNIGGTYLAPVIVDKAVAILGVGRMREVPGFDEQDNVIKKQICNFSWSADHRVVDGATMARAADVVRRLVEHPDQMILHLR
ncbi:Lipoamide acyltransferase component of branched-chain alpha-keto acid dehydrogenase complex [Apiospora rasikravindrae]|uniref:Dihydrolipoamide acetyltransferase component of pyruvate dehydrogenase complex n=1 Tax=Apiospora rasikravindrae TaxID=990691 RepID=A0ABR1T7S7_9PEZI